MEENNENEEKQKKSKKKKVFILIAIACILFIVILFVGFIVYETTFGVEKDYKPIIYFYPTEEVELRVKLVNENQITCSYPKYEQSWNILAKTDGMLKDLKTNRNLYALYYESENVKKFKVEDKGFVVSREDTAKFLEEKLEILGLNEREAEEFIVYWLPKLESSNYNYIRFATAEEINKNMPLEFSVEPDTLIRVLMTYKGLEKPIEVDEQQLTTPQRNGFVVVEWGGSEIK